MLKAGQLFFFWFQLFIKIKSSAYSIFPKNMFRIWNFHIWPPNINTTPQVNFNEGLVLNAGSVDCRKAVETRAAEREGHNGVKTLIVWLGPERTRQFFKYVTSTVRWLIRKKDKTRHNCAKAHYQGESGMLNTVHWIEEVAILFIHNGLCYCFPVALNVWPGRRSAA